MFSHRDSLIIYFDSSHSLGNSSADGKINMRGKM